MKRESECHFHSACERHCLPQLEYIQDAGGVEGGGEDEGEVDTPREKM